MIDFYTYAWLREDRTPYYIGKGRGKRAWRKGSPPKDRVLLLKTGLSEQEAFKHEVYMIAVFGRKDLGTGILRNLSDGGDGASGAVRSPETRIKISKAKKGKPRPDLSERNRQQKGIPKGPFTDTHRRNLSIAGKNKPPISEETKRKMSESAKRRAAKPEEKEKRARVGRETLEQLGRNERGRFVKKQSIA